MDLRFKVGGLAALLVFACAPVQAGKLAHADFDAIVALMPEMKQANDDAIAYYKLLEEQMMEIQKQLDSKETEYKAAEKAGKSGEKARLGLEDELRNLTERLTAFQVKSKNDFDEKRRELLQPVHEKFQEAVRQVAAEGKYQYIFDSSKTNPALLFADPGSDVSEKVMKKLGLKAGSR
jgi:outer membrane protein